MTIYIDNDYKCHLDGTDMRAVDTSFFDDKCKEFIEGYRFVPEGESWIREDGEIFTGEMVSPWRDYDSLSLAQSASDTTQSFNDAQNDILLSTIYNLIIEQ